MMKGLLRRVFAGALFGITLFSVVATIPVYAGTLDDFEYQQRAIKTNTQETNINPNTTTATIEGSQATPDNSGTTLDGMDSAEQIATIENNATTLEELKTRLRACSDLASCSDDRLTALAWCVSNEITAMKGMGYSLSAASGILANMKSESYCNPYILQGQSIGSFDIFTIGSNITLTIDGQSPYTLESDGARADALLRDTGRINRDYTGGSTPSAGVGLIQFTDCDTNYGHQRTLHDLQTGLRRSYVVNEWKQEAFCSDPWTAILKTNQYTYWTQSSYTDNTVKVEQSTGEEGQTELVDYTVTAANAVLSTATSDKINLAAADAQIAFIDSKDKACWMATDAGKAHLEGMGLRSDLTYDEYKTINCSAAEAAAYWCAYMERPGAGGLNTIDTRAAATSDNQWVKTLVGIAQDYYGGSLDLGTLKTYGVNPTSSLASTDVGSGSIYSKASLQSHNAALAHSGYLNESQCSDVMVQGEGLVTEELLAVAKREYLRQQEMNALVDWENEVKVNSFESILVLTGRRVVIFAGIILMIWSIFLYLAYWFDKLNTVSFVDLLGKMSFGHLCIADVDDHATYSNKREVGQKVKTLTVSHKDILFISCIGFAIATIMVTGLLFKWLYFIVMKIYNFLQ